MISYATLFSYNNVICAHTLFENLIKNNIHFLCFVRVKVRNDDTNKMKMNEKNRLKWNECSRKESGFQSSWHFSFALILNATPNEEESNKIEKSIHTTAIF